MDNKIKTIVIFLLCLTMASVVFASDEHIDAQGEVNITYNGENTPSGQEGYVSSISIGSDVYYLNIDQLKQVATLDPMIEKMYHYAEGTYSGNDLFVDGTPDRFTIQVNDTDFSFDYKTGETVGMNDNADVVTKLYSSDGSEMPSLDE